MFVVLPFFFSLSSSEMDLKSIKPLRKGNHRSWKKWGSAVGSRFEKNIFKCISHCMHTKMCLWKYTWLAQKWNSRKTWGSLNFSATLVSTLAPAIKCFHGCPSHTYREVFQTTIKLVAQCSVAIGQTFSFRSLHEFFGLELCIQAHEAAWYLTTYIFFCSCQQRRINSSPKRIRSRKKMCS